jgi:hypothetical protein
MWFSRPEIAVKEPDAFTLFGPCKARFPLCVLEQKDQTGIWKRRKNMVSLSLAISHQTCAEECS